MPTRDRPSTVPAAGPEGPEPPGTRAREVTPGVDGVRSQCTPWVASGSARVRQLSPTGVGHPQVDDLGPGPGRLRAGSSHEEWVEAPPRGPDRAARREAWALVCGRRPAVDVGR